MGKKHKRRWTLVFDPVGSGIDSMLSTRSILTIGEPLQVIGAVLNCLDVPGITRSAADLILSAYADQRTESARVSGFDVIQGITKAAQSLDAFAQETLERAAGTAMLWTVDRWESAFALSRTIGTKQLKRIFQSAV